MAKQNLTDRKLQALKPAPEGQRYEIMDQVLAGFRPAYLRHRSAVLHSQKPRYPGSSHLSTRRTLGEYPALTLEAAREKAADWRKLIKLGTDPAIAELRRREAEQLKQATTVAAVADDFFAEKLAGERKGREAERTFRREFLPAWGQRPITEINDLDILAVVKNQETHRAGRGA